MKIGIVGAENSHSIAVAKTLNVEKACGSARVALIWGETRAFAEKAALEGQIPEIVKKPQDMIGRVDGVMIDHRHARYHIPVADMFVDAGMPVFVDKPFSWTVKEGWDLLIKARKKGIPVTSFSAIPEQSAFQKDFRRQIRAAGKILSIETSGPCDFKSKWGGVFFYGIHQVDSLIKAFGTGVKSVQVVKASKGNPNAVAILNYEEGGAIVSMNFIAQGKSAFIFRAFGEKGMAFYENKYDPNPYLTGVKKFLGMFRTGKEPFSLKEILEPIAVLEALDKSWKKGKKVNIKQIPDI
ncbi:Gfo/Idh/MocA family oxidoreductase [Candidatus Sumerlaeota bacterium]|nr:Gfo/Idh/MocA family oxidoreductase [Candidatus Sumerlaeota bacterium]